MRPKVQDRYCRMCRALLPLPEPAALLRGGRPRLYCGASCKRQYGRRWELIGYLRACGTLARTRGDIGLAERYQQHADAFAAPYRTQHGGNDAA